TPTPSAGLRHSGWQGVELQRENRNSRRRPALDVTIALDRVTAGGWGPRSPRGPRSATGWTRPTDAARGATPWTSTSSRRRPRAGRSTGPARRTRFPGGTGPLY